MNSPDFYIVGGGTFAVKLSEILHRHTLDFIFTDEIQTEPIAGRPVCKAFAITNKNAFFFIAISMEPYAGNAISRLLAQGIPRKNLLDLKFETAINILDLMLAQDKSKTLMLLQDGIHTVAELEQHFFSAQYACLTAARHWRHCYQL